MVYLLVMVMFLLGLENRTENNLSGNVLFSVCSTNAMVYTAKAITIVK